MSRHRNVLVVGASPFIAATAILTNLSGSAEADKSRSLHAGSSFAAPGATRPLGDLPAIILTGDISTVTLNDIARQGYIHRSKPMRAEDLTRMIRSLLTKVH